MADLNYTSKAQIAIDFRNNLPHFWKISANNFMISADLLSRALDEHAEEYHDYLYGIKRSWHLLVAYAFENIIKGISVKKYEIPDLARDFWFKNNRGHKFLTILDDALENTTFMISQKDKDILVKMETFAIWAGKYESAKKAEQLDLSHALDYTLFLTANEQSQALLLFDRLQNIIPNFLGIWTPKQQAWLEEKLEKKNEE